MKRVKKFMREKIQICTDVLSSDQNRLIIGLTFTGLGVGFIASAYLHPPKNN